VESQGRSEQVRKISPPPGFDSRTVQPVVSRYTDYAILPAWYNLVGLFSPKRPVLMYINFFFCYLNLLQVIETESV
jgi:hypothetical protein